MATDKPAKLSSDTYMKMGLWAVPIIFAAGSLYYQQMRTSEQAQATDHMLHQHELLEAHPVIKARVVSLEQESAQMLQEQRVIRVEQSRAAENISAICQATNARCK